MPFVKICGLTRAADAECALESGADAVGFVFHARSPRAIEPDSASWIRALSGPAWKVGVFVNATLEQMSRAVEECGLGGVQLHGGEPAEFAAEVKRRLQVTVIRAFRLDEPLAELEKSPADFLLLDHYARGQFGGTGQTVDWDAAARLARDGLAARLILSGGLSAENVRDACRAVRPFGVDASSRLESAPGVKDHARIRDFIAHAKEQIPSR